MNETTLWGGGALEGGAPVVRKVVTLPESGFRLGTWVAPAAFGAPEGSTIPVLDASSTELLVSLGLSRHGVPVARVRLGDQDVRLLGADRVPELAWTRLELVVDHDDDQLEPSTALQVSLWADDVEVDRAWLTEGLPADCCDRTVDVVIGGQGDGWFGWFVGVLGTVWLAPPTAEPPARPKAAPDDTWTVSSDAYEGDRDRPRWHFLPPRHWMNEPHGIVHHRGRHHLFYQRNELGPFWGEISWGHAVSTDLVRWTDVGHALAPWDTDCAPDGVWSGSSAFTDDGVPLLFFTAGDMRDTPNQRTAIARPLDLDDPDLRQWSASAPVTTAHQAVAGLAQAGLTMLPDEFRDPFVWREAGSWFQLVGAGIEGRGGTALLFRCDDAEPTNWTFVGPLAIGDAVSRPDTGVMWELPVLVPVGSGDDGRPRHALIVTPWWPVPTEHSLLHAWYWVGTWDATTATWTPEHPEPRDLDHGGWLTGVTSSLHPDGRTLLWSITQDLLGDEEHRRRRWAGSAGVPLQVRYADGDLEVAPIDEIATLRAEPVPTVLREEDTLTWEAGPSWELETTLVLPVGSRASLCVRGGAARIVLERSGEQTLTCTVHRPGATEPNRVERTWNRRVTGDEIPLRVLVDHSVVEAFVAGQVITTRAWSTGHTFETATLRCARAELPDVRVHRLDAAPVGQDRRPRPADVLASPDAVRRSPGAGRRPVV